jgi:hypothetical protein
VAKKIEMAKNSEEYIKASLVNIELYKINGEQLKHDSTAKKIKRVNFVDIYELKGKNVKIKLSEKLFFIPEGRFKLDFEVIGTFEFNREVKEENIKEQLDFLALPLFSYSSFLIAFMAERFTNIPLILPPEKAD